MEAGQCVVRHPGGDASVDIGRDEGERLSQLQEAHEPRDGCRIGVYHI